MVVAFSQTSYCVLLIYIFVYIPGLELFILDLTCCIEELLQRSTGFSFRGFANFVS